MPTGQKARETADGRTGPASLFLVHSPGDDAVEVGERIRLGVAELDLGGPDADITVSIGTAAFPTDASLMEELVDKSDWAMYLAKRLGRDRVVPFGRVTDASLDRDVAPLPGVPEKESRVQAGVLACQSASIYPFLWYRSAHAGFWLVLGNF